MFYKILIVNWGEIVCCIIDMVCCMGVEIVVVFFDVDCDVCYVVMVDQVVYIGVFVFRDSYLCGDVIICVVLDSGVQVIYLGYGFFSENFDFVDVVIVVGLVFIGFLVVVICKMGFKDVVKVLMVDVGVLVVLGYYGCDQDVDYLVVQVQVIGWLVFIKVVVGGGGKGMWFVDCVQDFVVVLVLVQGEVVIVFGNFDVLIEKYIFLLCYIEIQVFGDGMDVVYFFECDCLLQCCYQKVIEEVLVFGMILEMCVVMGQVVVCVVCVIGYCGVGMVEFIVDGMQGLCLDGFWFMEMNICLQVEYFVIEVIIGVDLVEWQLCVVLGQFLFVCQQDLIILGYVFEVWFYVEDVLVGFLFVIGMLVYL